MIPAKDYMKTLTTRLQARFGSRLLYVGLQGSYARGEATEASDIDPMVILADLSVRDLAAYRAILEEVGYFSLSCGFLCGREDIWIRDLMTGYQGDSPSELAQQILRRSEEICQGEDDGTVLAVHLERSRDREG